MRNGPELRQPDESPHRERAAAREAWWTGAPTACRWLRLAPQPEAPSLAGSLVADACHSWLLPRLLGPARLVVSELVFNAVEHARTELVVTLSRRGGGLLLTVADGDPRLPAIREPARHPGGAPLDERGHGLRTVHRAATVWGAAPTGTGKVVWALVRPPAADPVAGAARRA